MVILLIITLVFLIVSDFRGRFVYMWQIVLFFVAQLIYCFLTLGQKNVTQNILINSIALLFLFLCVGIYVIFRFRKKEKIIGWGDILFIFCLTPYFELYQFIFFMVISMSLSLAGWTVSYLYGQRNKEIPLVSVLGICYSILLIYDNITA